MKKFPFLLLVFIISLTSSLKAQKVDYKLIMGVSGNRIITQEANSANEKGTIGIGYQLGGLAHLEFGNKTIQSGLSFSQFESTIYGPEVGGESVALSYTFNRLEFPVLFGLELWKVRLNAGPSLGLLLTAKERRGIDGFERNVADDYNRATMDFKMAIEADITGSFFIGAEYKTNLTRFSESQSYNQLGAFLGLRIF